MKANQKEGVEVEKKKDREGGMEYVGQPVVGRGRETGIGKGGGGGFGGEGEGGGGRELIGFSFYQTFRFL